MRDNRFLKRLRKKAKKGLRGWPLATIAFYGPNLSQATKAANDFFAQAVVVTKGLQQRERVKARLEHALATEFPSAVGRVYPLELGPPVGWPVQYRVSGLEPDQERVPSIRARAQAASTRAAP
jgi:hypothetical protein